MRYRNKTLREKEKSFFIHYVKYETGNGDNMYKRTDMRMWTDMGGGGGGSAHVGRYADRCVCVCVCVCVCGCV